MRTPDLTQAAATMAAAGVQRIRIVPLFFGRRRPPARRLSAPTREGPRQCPSIEFEVTQAAGEDDQVLDALATFALEASGVPTPYLN